MCGHQHIVRAPVHSRMRNRADADRPPSHQANENKERGARGASRRSRSAARARAASARASSQAAQQDHSTQREQASRQAPAPAAHATADGGKSERISVHAPPEICPTSGHGADRSAARPTRMVSVRFGANRAGLGPVSLRLCRSCILARKAASNRDNLDALVAWAVWG